MSTQLTDVQLELDLKRVLEDQRPLSEVAPLLINALRSKEKAKRQTVIRFLQLHPEWNVWKDEFEPWLRSQFEWPWEFLIPWLSHQRLTLSLDDRQKLKEIWVEQNVTHLLAKNSDWSVVFEEHADWRSSARFDLQRRILLVRDLLFEELNTWKSQRMREQEKRALSRLRKKFPMDHDIQKQFRSFREVQAFETLQERIRQRRNQAPQLKFEEDVTELPDLWRQELQKKGTEYPELFYDFAIHCCFCEDWAWALHLANQAAPSQARDWLEVEILLKLRRYVDVLQALTVVEARWAEDSETFFASAYVRAQAYFGLGRKQQAFEVLESLLASRPLYRQGVELLNLWRSPG